MHIRCSNNAEYEDFCLLGCEAECPGRLLPTFRRMLLPLCSGEKIISFFRIVCHERIHFTMRSFDKIEQRMADVRPVKAIVFANRQC
jgi:hypothetical protein